MDPSFLDDIVAKLLEVRHSRPGKQVQLTEAEIKQLFVASKEIFLSQPDLLELEAPIKICESRSMSRAFQRVLTGAKHILFDRVMLLFRFISFSPIF